MTGFLLDTNVLSEFSRTPHPQVNRWVKSAAPDALFTSVLTFGEIRKGIERLPPGRKRSDLEGWFETDLNEWFGTNLLPVTKAISNRWGILDALARSQGRQLGNIDGLIAATALEHDLTVVTRNTRDFEYLGGVVVESVGGSTFIADRTPWRLRGRLRRPRRHSIVRGDRSCVTEMVKDACVLACSNF